METVVFYRLDQKSLNFKLRERISTSQNLELKANGWLNTTEGNVDYRAHLHKTFSLGGLSLRDGPADTPLILGAGVAVNGASREHPLLSVGARKHFALTDGNNTVLSVRGYVDYDPQTQRTFHKGRLRLHQKFPRWSKPQDLRVSVGLDLDGNDRIKDSKPEPYVQIRENNWALHYQRRGFHLSYDL